MAATHTTIERLADWACDLALDDVPAEVVDLNRAQRRSVLAAVAASTGDAASRRVLAGIESWAPDGDVALIGTDRRVPLDDALYGATALAVALDFDDYACFGHTGHTAVLVPLLVATQTGASAADQLGAQVVANEVEARLGGACLVGPLNGQLWSFIHSAGTALAAGRMWGLDRTRLAHALALSLYQAPRPTVPGFMAPDSKLLTVSEPAVMGLRAARLAAAGVTGPLDVLDHDAGFFSGFAYTPLPAVLGGLGEGWATRTLSVKPYPGCAYVDTTVDALLSIDPLPAADEIAEIVVDASVLSCEMDALSRRYGTDGPPTPVTVNFSIPWNVAVTVAAGRLTPTETSEAWLTDNHAALSDLARKVTLRHDWSLTLTTARAMAPLLPPRSMFDGAGGIRKVGRALAKVRGDRDALHVGRSEVSALARALRADGGLGTVRDAMRSRRLWDDEALSDFRMAFPARVTIRRTDGTELVAEAETPRGGAGNPEVSPEVVSRDKLAAWGPRAWGVEGTDRIAKAIDTDADDLPALLG